jgi:hypothetical protein
MSDTKETEQTQALELVGQSVGELVAHASAVHDQLVELGPRREGFEEATAVEYVRLHEVEIAQTLVKLGAAAALVLSTEGTEIALGMVPADEVSGEGGDHVG